MSYTPDRGLVFTEKNIKIKISIKKKTYKNWEMNLNRQFSKDENKMT